MDSVHTQVDLTPDPRVLIALTHTPLKPIDALCELIDNALDSFALAKERGMPVKSPMVIVDLPTAAEARAGGGAVQIRDNGLGLTREEAERALRAGFSGNNRYDRLGLFGMGFNIATGKIGRITRFVSTNKSDDHAIEVRIDLPAMQQRGHYMVPVEVIPKPEGMEQGTLLEITSWWPEGNQNSGFAINLAGNQAEYTKPKVREQLGRRYAAILKRKDARIILNGEPCEPFYHCAWDASRSVEKRTIGAVSAKFSFDEVISSQTRCTQCDTQILEGATCSNTDCGSSATRTIEERIRGWVGIQRYDDANHYGIDLIRNGRAIRILEKEAFFTFVNELGERELDYPVDSQFGRIIGEVELNHVPVDFMKQDFQRTSPEWARAMKYLRGESSLKPRQPGAEQNSSPIFKLYQGYRRVRTPGRVDAYMGQWDVAKGKPIRLSRDKERDLLKRFQKGQAGYFDDTEWWRLVEEADRKPAEELAECEKCDAQNLKSAEACSSCDHILRGKSCISCKETILESAEACPHCGNSQIPEVEEPWDCPVCLAANAAESTHCAICNAIRGSKHPLDTELLRERSTLDNELSIQGLSVTLANGTHSDPVDVRVYQHPDPLRPRQASEEVPVFAVKGEEMAAIELFIDPRHEAFAQLRLSPHMFVAAEVADFLFTKNRQLAGGKHTGLHTLAQLQWQVISESWRDELATSPASLVSEIRSFFDDIRERLASSLGDQAEDAFAELDDDAQRRFVENLLEAGKNLSELAALKKSGDFIRFTDEAAVVRIFKALPTLFFDGRVWRDSYNQTDGLAAGVVEDIRKEQVRLTGSCLEECALFPKLRQPDDLITTRAKASLGILRRRLGD